MEFNLDLSEKEKIAFKLENEDKLWECVARKEDYIPYLPPRITFITSKRCNLSCRFCYHFRHKYMHNVSPLNMPVMDLRLVHKVAYELFPTLQYYETTLLGDPFLSPHLETELKLAGKYGVYMRPTTNGTTLTDRNLDLVSGHMDWLKCSFDSHKRGVYNTIRIGARFENTIRKLKNFNRLRETMSPRPYFRMGLVLNDLNVDEIPDYFLWCHEYMGVDDVEIMGLNVDADHIESLAVFDKPKVVNDALDKVIELAIDKKYKLRLDFTQMPTLHGDRFVCQKRSAELRKAQEQYGFVPPRDFEKMSYVIQNPRNRWEIGDVGYVWSNNMREQSICIEFMNRPFILDNGNVEVCGNCNTFMPGNLKGRTFANIWNDRRYRYIRRKMYVGEIKKDWPDACNDCICMGVTYDRGRSDHRHKSFYRVVEIDKNQKETRVPVGDTHRPVDFPEQLDNLTYISRLENLEKLPRIPAGGKNVYLSDIEEAGVFKSRCDVHRDHLNCFTPLSLNGKAYQKGLATQENEIEFTIPNGMARFKSGFGLAENANANKKAGKPADAKPVKLKFQSEKGELYNRDYTPEDGEIEIDVPVDGHKKFVITLSGEALKDTKAIFANARFEA